MPIELSENIRALDQEAFGAIAYDVMEQAFQVHNKLGRFFDEDAYQHELAHMLQPRAVIEAGITVKHADFCKLYSIDLLVDHGAIFELKTVSHLTDEHRAQLLNYITRTSRNQTGHKTERTLNSISCPFVFVSRKSLLFLH